MKTKTDDMLDIASYNQADLKLAEALFELQEDKTIETSDIDTIRTNKLHKALQHLGYIKTSGNKRPMVLSLRYRAGDRLIVREIEYSETFNEVIGTSEMYQPLIFTKQELKIFDDLDITIDFSHKQRPSDWFEMED